MSNEFSFTTRIPGGEVNANGRVYPVEAMKRAFEEAMRKGELTVVDRRTGDSAGGPIELSGRRFVKPTFAAKGLRQADDGSLYMDVHVDDQATAVDRLADIARDE